MRENGREEDREPPLPSPGRVGGCLHGRATLPRGTRRRVLYSCKKYCYRALPLDYVYVVAGFCATLKRVWTCSFSAYRQEDQHSKAEGNLGTRTHAYRQKFGNDYTCVGRSIYFIFDRSAPGARDTDFVRRTPLSRSVPRTEVDETYLTIYDVTGALLFRQ